MIHLSNGEKVLAAYIVPASPGMKPNGLVLAETETDWVTWSVYWDGETTGDDHGQTHELWEAETGHYWTKSSHTIESKRMAERDFGLRLQRFIPTQSREAIYHDA